MKYITVLDFEVGRVYQYKTMGEGTGWNPDSESIEVYLSELGHNLTNCEWMIHKDNEIITK